MLKKVPYGLLLLVAYLIMTITGTMTALTGEVTEAVTIWDSIGHIADVVIKLGPIVLTVLVIVNSIKPMVGQVGGLVCLILGVAYGYHVFGVYNNFSEYIAYSDDLDTPVIYMLASMLAAGFLAIECWLAGAKIQDEEVSGIYSGVGAIGMAVQVLLALSGTSVGVAPVFVIPTLLLMNAVRKLPAVFVPGVSARGSKVKNVVILAILVALYYFGNTMLLNLM